MRRTAFILALIGGCVSGPKVIDSPAVAPSLAHAASAPATQAAAQSSANAQTLAGQVVAAVQADLKSQVQAQLEAKGVDYNSEFGVGPAMIVGGVCVLALFLMYRLVRARDEYKLKRRGIG